MIHSEQLIDSCKQLVLLCFINLRAKSGEQPPFEPAKLQAEGSCCESFVTELLQHSSHYAFDRFQLVHAEQQVWCRQVLLP